MYLIRKLLKYNDYITRIRNIKTYRRQLHIKSLKLIEKKIISKLKQNVNIKLALNIGDNRMSNIQYVGIIK